MKPPPGTILGTPLGGGSLDFFPGVKGGGLDFFPGVQGEGSEDFFPGNQGAGPRIFSPKHSKMCHFGDQ